MISVVADLRPEVETAIGEQLDSLAAPSSAISRGRHPRDRRGRDALDRASRQRRKQRATESV
jgi:hypothetical protein